MSRDLVCAGVSLLLAAFCALQAGRAVSTGEQRWNFPLGFVAGLATAMAAGLLSGVL